MENLEIVTSVNTEGEVETTLLQTTPITLSADFNTALDSKISSLKSGNMMKGISLSPQYLEFAKVGDTIQGIFLGFKKITKNENGASKSLICAVWADENKAAFMNGGITFVNACQEMPIGQAFEATLVELKPASNGKVKIYQINPLFD